MMTLEQKAETLEEALKRAMKKGYSVFGLATNPTFAWKVTVSSEKVVVAYKLRDNQGIWQYGNFVDTEIFFDPELSFWRWLMGDDEDTVDLVRNKFLENKGRYDVLKGVLTRQDKSKK